MIPIPQFSPKNSLAGVVAGLFQNNEPGVWYDPSDLSTMFQDAAGTTPVTAVEQPVGLMLDKSKGLVLGPELVVNGTFDTDLSGWTVLAGNVSVWAAGRAYVGGGGNITGIYQEFPAVAGKTYVVSASIQHVTGTGARLRVTDGGGFFNSQDSNVVTSGTRNVVVYVRATGTTMRLLLRASDNTATPQAAYFDNISVRELPGNHATQPTTTSRPVLSARYNLLTNTEALNTQSRSVRAVSHIISFSGTGSITLSGVYTGVLTGTGVNDRVYLQFTPTAGALTLTVAGSVTKAQLEEV